MRTPDLDWNSDLFGAFFFQILDFDFYCDYGIADFFFHRLDFDFYSCVAFALYFDFDFYFDFDDDADADFCFCFDFAFEFWNYYVCPSICFSSAVSSGWCFGYEVSLFLYYYLFL
jgi:hypothetical protein